MTCRLTWVGCLAVLLASCAPSPPPVDTGPSPAAEPALNESFLSEDLDVTRFEGVFESESREVYRSREQIADALGLAPGMAIADIGAGTGLFMPLFATRVGEQGQVYAVDISPRFLQHLRTRAKEAEFSQVEVVAASQRSAQLPAQSVDVVFVCDTYHHFEHPAETLESLRSALRPGGALVIVDFERIPGVTEDWLLEHVRADKQTFRREIEAAGFTFDRELEVEGLSDNYILRFRRP